MNSRRDGLKQSYLPLCFFPFFFLVCLSPSGQEAEEKLRVRDNVIEGLPSTAALRYKAQVTSASRSSRPVSPAPERAPAKKQRSWRAMSAPMTVSSLQSHDGDHWLVLP